MSTEQARKESLKWFADAKYGMFYHFGLYTLLGDNENKVRESGDKAGYRKLMDKFNPKRFHADAWVECAASMGARYIVPTSKHAEGFCLWDSKLTKYTSTNTPFKRDVMAELAEACAKAKDIKFAFYFNLETWLNEGVNDDVWNEQGMSYPDYIKGQLSELLTNYGPVALVWFDHGHPTLGDRMGELVQHIQSIQPHCLVNDRGVSKGGRVVGDFLTPERILPESDPSRGLVIEACDAMGTRAWGYRRNEAFWSAPELARRASVCASKGYNYLLNVEPAPDGSIRPECRARARRLGAWTAKHAAALNAAPCPAIDPVDPNLLHEPTIGVCTRDGATLHVHLHQWPVSDEILLPVSGKLRKCGLKAAYSEKGVVVGGLPPSPPAGFTPWILTVEFEAPPTALPRLDGNPLEPDASGALSLQPGAATIETENGVIIPRLNHFPDGSVSVGLLQSVGDTLAWNVRLQEEGEFEMHAAFGSIKSQDNAGFALSSPIDKLEGRTWLTEHWSKPTRRAVGKLRLAKGDNRVTLRVTDEPNGAFSDVHGVWLVPVE